MGECIQIVFVEDAEINRHRASNIPRTVGHAMRCREYGTSWNQSSATQKPTGLLKWIRFLKKKLFPMR